MEFKHLSVLFDECMTGLAIKPSGIYVDGTLGGGGHASGICERLSEDGVLIGIDRDQDALEAASAVLEKYKCRKYFIQSNYSDIADILESIGLEGIDGALLDLGVSSFQLDNADRGFSYMKDAELDMRMNRADIFTAYDVINGYSKAELTRIIKEYGEERWASRISDFITKTRKISPIVSTRQLVEIIKAAVPASARRTGPHPAKRTFQAIRIEVNDELGHLESALENFLNVMNDGGRMCVITFHSLEDRIVKSAFNRHANPCICPKDLPVCMCGREADVKKISSKPILSSDEEVKKNPRSRSARLRIVEKIRTSKQ